MDDLIVIGVYIFFNIMLWFKMKDKRFRWSYELLIRAAAPIAITVCWAYFFKSYEIAAILFVALMLSYGLNFSEVFLREHFTSIGERLIIISFHNIEERYNTLNIYLDTSRESIDTRQTFEDNIRNLDEKERAEYEKLVAPLERFDLIELYLCWLDFLKTDFTRYLKIYMLYIPKEEIVDELTSKRTRERMIVRIKEKIIPKVIHFNSARLQNEEVHGRKIPTIAGVLSPHDAKILIGLERLAVAMENVKSFPHWWENKILKEENEALKNTNEQIWAKYQNLRKYTERYKLRFKKEDKLEEML